MKLLRFLCWFGRHDYRRRVRASTGHPVHPELSKADYIGTLQFAQGHLVFHLFLFPWEVLYG